MSDDLVKRLLAAEQDGRMVDPSGIAAEITALHAKVQALEAGLDEAYACAEEWKGLNSIASAGRTRAEAERDALRARLAQEAEFLATVQKARDDLLMECKRLWVAIGQARREGVEAAAKWHEQEIEELNQQIARNDAYRKRTGNTQTVSDANNACREHQNSHHLAAAAIRALIDQPAKREDGA